MINSIIGFKNGMTVKELKELIKDWPEQRANGEPTEVWLCDTDGYSNPVVEISNLNLDEDGNADVILSV